MKRLGIIILITMAVVLACNTTVLANTHNEKVACLDVNRDAVISNDIDKLTEDICKLYNSTADRFNVPYKYVKIMHLIAGGRVIYTDKNPDIYTDVTSTALRAPFDIDGALNKYYMEAPVDCGDESLERPNKYFLPDASYNVMANIVIIMQERYEYNKGKEGTIFNKLIDDVKSDILFYEAMLKYCGSTEEEINNVLNTYIELLNAKDKNEYIIYINSEGKYKILTKYEDILSEYSENSKNMLAIALSLDGCLAITNDIYDITEGEVELFKVGDTNRENLLIAAMSVAGDVRYIWGGGHMGANNIEGVSPLWEMFSENYYNSNKGCLAPRGTWCPIHGHMEESENSCLFKDRKVTSINDYLRLRGNIISRGGKIITYNKLVEIYGGDLKGPIEPHRLEGLDCSGYIGWVYNQIDKDRTYKGVAADFVRMNNMREISMYSKLLPGDVIAWDKHIMAIVGRVSDSNKAYIIIEQSPNTIRLGVLTYNGVSSEEIDKAMRIAYGANCKLAEALKNESVNVYNINNLEYRYNEEDGTSHRVLSIGRLSKQFEDANKIVHEYGKPLVELYADEIINHTIKIIGDRGSK